MIHDQSYVAFLKMMIILFNEAKQSKTKFKLDHFNENSNEKTLNVYRKLKIESNHHQLSVIFRVYINE